MIDESKLTPAPWEADGYATEPDDWLIGVEDSDGESLRTIGGGLRKIDAEFAALCRNWLAVASERRWGIVPWGRNKWSVCSDGGTHLLIFEQSTITKAMEAAVAHHEWLNAENQK